MQGFNWKKLAVRALILLLCAFTALALFSPGARAFTFGDVNHDGVVDVRDVALVMRHILNLETLGGAEQELADVNADGAIDVRDATLMMRKALGLIDHFPDIDHEGVALIEEFIVEEGISPGKKMVVVILNVSDPQEYTVQVGETKLEYRDSIEGFRREVHEEEGKLSKVSVSRTE